MSEKEITALDLRVEFIRLSKETLDILRDKMITIYREEGAATERERIRGAVLNLGGLIMGESDYILTKHVLFILKDGNTK